MSNFDIKRVDIRDDYAVVYLPFAEKKLEQLKKRRRRENQVLKQKIYVTDGTAIYLETGAIDRITILNEAIIIFLFNVISKGTLFYAVTSTPNDFTLYPVVRILKPESTPGKTSLVMTGNSNTFKTDGNEFTGNWRVLSGTESTAEYIETTLLKETGIDFDVLDNILLYGNSYFKNTFFPQTSGQIFLKANYGTNIVYSPPDFETSKKVFFENTTVFYGSSQETITCRGRHPFVLNEQGKLLYSELTLKGKSRRINNNTTYFLLSWHSTAYGSRIRDWTITYRDEEGEKESSFKSDSSDDGNALLHVPMAVLSETEAIYFVETATKPLSSENSYWGRIGRTGFRPAQHGYCCGIVNISMPFFYEDENGNMICETKEYTIPATSTLRILNTLSQLKISVNTILYFGSFTVSSGILEKTVSTVSQNPQDGGFVGVFENHVPESTLQCPTGYYPLSNPSFEEEDNETIWQNAFKIGHISYSDHVGDPLTGRAPIDIQRNEIHKGVQEITFCDYDNTSHFGVGIVRKTSVDYQNTMTQYFYFNDNIELGNFFALINSLKKEVNTEKKEYAWYGISSYPVTNPYTGDKYYLSTGTLFMREYYIREQKDYLFSLFVRIGEKSWTFPIEYQGSEEYVFSFEVDHTTNENLLEAHEVSGPVYPEQTFHFVSETTFKTTGQRIREVSTFIKESEGIMVYTFIVEKSTGTGWEFEKRIIGIVSTRYTDDDDNPIRKEFVISESLPDLSGDSHADFPYKESCAIGIKS